MLPTMSLAYASCERFYELGICFGGRLLPCIGRLKGESEGGLKGGLIGGLKGSSVLGAAVGDAADGQSAVEAVLQVPCGPHCLPQRFLVSNVPPGAAHDHGCLVRRGGDGCDAVAGVPAQVDGLGGVLEVGFHHLVGVQGGGGHDHAPPPLVARRRRHLEPLRPLPADPVEGQAVGDLVGLPLEVGAGCHDHKGTLLVWQPSNAGDDVALGPALLHEGLVQELRADVELLP
mmetsp:Transcript_11245/g.33759  ORF Transcript_11245/g.33759 Transcript_11245/m.33759 type:complete len:231 (-) Transcript_11245:1885-2577(-)